MRIESIADHLDVVEMLARWQWDEWGRPEFGGSLESWTAGLRERTRRDAIPTSYVALDDAGTLLGGLTLVEHEMSTHRDLTPWVAGVFVRPDMRGRGVGSALMRYVMGAATQMGFSRLYLYTESARGFYERLGWQAIAEDVYEGQPVTIMMVKLTP